jgi:hypothetical protein
MAVSRNDRRLLNEDNVEYIGNGGSIYRTRARLLAELEGLPDGAYISALHAAALIDTTYAQLANWRSQRRGPPFVGTRKFVRYRLGDLKAFMASRAMQTAPLNETWDTRIKESQAKAVARRGALLAGSLPVGDESEPRNPAEARAILSLPKDVGFDRG